MTPFLIMVMIAAASMIIIVFGSSSKKSSKNIASSRAPSQKVFVLTDDLIIRLAKRLGGKITASDLSAQTSLSIEQAKARLDIMQEKGICEIDLDAVDRSGKIYYHFV